MSPTRRGAVRVALGVPGMLWYGPRRTPCVVVEASVTGARVRLEEPTLVPNAVELVMTIDGRAVALDAHVRRSVAGGELALSFDRPDAGGLPRLVAEVQRRAIRAGVPPVEDRRRAPRPE